MFTPDALPRNFAIYGNARAGKGAMRSILQKVCSTFEKQGILYAIFDHDLPPSLSTFTDLLVIGGDGTMNYVANHFGDIIIPISLISSGTGNDFACALQGARLGVEEQLRVAIEGRVRWLDAGICNDRIFVNGVGLGFDGRVVKAMRNGSWFSGGLAYYAKVLPLLFSYKERYLSITTDNGAFNGYYFMIAIANGSSYGGGFQVAPDADMADAMLDVVFIREITLRDRLFNLHKVRRGEHEGVPFISKVRTRGIRISSPAPLDVHLDGEYTKGKDFSIMIAPCKYRFRG
ncbi:YegS/Rv2252/BmrU family lipid kinase [Chitinophaga horti]|uniref:YegS/Rv2252/BmrU family lipid kinase n=1 Tax=Chitinophaga horti TaxID=2920382 RepID=A0ABY6J1H3_9BACT|nr:YegS/Rv2252/BmrU family lipid kinase [Chitinophaga horti]UYQ91997.1 YegS/Rv2252/BmrU family lipid kinase [Chitinophaga horti]